MKKILVSLILCLITGVMLIHHIGTIMPLPVTDQEMLGPAAVLIEKTSESHRHLFLEGSDYHRGYEAGKVMKDALLKTEGLLVSKLDHFLPSTLIQNAFFTFAMIWFHDEDKYLDQGSLKEMQGVGEWAPKQYDYLASGFTRQIAYHGLHEVGQMFVDEDRADMACLASAVKVNNHWVVGRNFDFDVDGFFDREKFLKWVYPESGIPFVSVIWGGMVGVVTGVNQEGIFVSINAAGTKDFARVGTPTTILVKNILQNAKTVEEGIKILQSAQTFITDIFVIADRKQNKVAVIEKSPRRIDIRFLEKSDIIANHVNAKIWEKDKTNYHRKVNLTSESRELRGKEIIAQSTLSPLETTVAILRDKKLPKNKTTHFGNRGAIDSLIASQSVIFDLESGVFYVNYGPGTIGQYIGYDIEESFRTKHPTVAGRLPKSQDIDEKSYQDWQQWMGSTASMLFDLHHKGCPAVKDRLKEIENQSYVHYDKERFLGDYAQTCLNNNKLAIVHWKKALDLFPPYKKQRDYLEEKLK